MFPILLVAKPGKPSQGTCWRLKLSVLVSLLPCAHIYPLPLAPRKQASPEVSPAPSNPRLWSWFDRRAHLLKRIEVDQLGRTFVSVVIRPTWPSAIRSPAVTHEFIIDI